MMCAQHVDILQWATARCALFLLLCAKGRVTYRRDRTGLKVFPGAYSAKGILNEVLCLHGECERWTKSHLLLTWIIHLWCRKAHTSSFFKDYLIRCLIKIVSIIWMLKGVSQSQGYMSAETLTYRLFISFPLTIKELSDGGNRHSVKYAEGCAYKRPLSCAQSDGEIMTSVSQRCFYDCLP